MSIISMFLVTLCLVIEMNKKSWIIISIIAILLIGGGIYFYFRNRSTNPNETNYKAGKTSINHNENAHKENYDKENNKQENSNDSEANEKKQGITESQDTSAPTTEEQIATFSTKIYNKDSARQNNISITCNTLNETIVKNGNTFSFCQTVGESSTSKGYQKADIFDKNGNKKKGLGGRKLSD